MKISRRYDFLIFLVLAYGIPATHAIAENNKPQHLVFASNPNYPSSEKSDKGQTESASDKEDRSRWLIDAQYTSIADLRNQFGGASAVPVMINGNMTASGESHQRSYIKAVLQNKLNNLYDYGLGRHDYDTSPSGCRECAAASVDAFAANAGTPSGMYESSNYVYGEIPLFTSGSATQQSWLHATFSEDRKQLTVNVIANNNWRQPVASHTIPIR
jgi:hypothetical protein